MGKTNQGDKVNESRLWRCEDCGNEGEMMPWSYDDLATRGGPVCPSCDADMVLISKK